MIDKKYESIFNPMEESLHNHILILCIVCPPLVLLSFRMIEFLLFLPLNPLNFAFHNTLGHTPNNKDVILPLIINMYLDNEMYNMPSVMCCVLYVAFLMHASKV